jgi:hypothetical protein
MVKATNQMVNGWLMVNMRIQNGTQIRGTQIWLILAINGESRGREIN